MYIIFKCLQAGLADIFAVVGSIFLSLAVSCIFLFFEALRLLW